MFIINSIVVYYLGYNNRTVDKDDIQQILCSQAHSEYIIVKGSWMVKCTNKLSSNPSKTNYIIFSKIN